MTKLKLSSKLPNEEDSIFSKMSRLAAEHNAIDLSQGFPNFQTDEFLKELVTKYMDSGFNQYAPMAGVLELREEICRKIEKLYGRKYNPETEVTITNGATQALHASISAFVKKDDEVIIFKPAYDSYEPTVKLNGGVPILIGLKGEGYKIDWDELKSKINSKTKMIIINTPHNPTGTLIERNEMLQLEEILENTNIILLSDEVYEHLVFDGKEHQSVSRFPALSERSIICASFGKTFHNTGWKTGYCVAPKELMEEIRKIHQVTVFCINHPMQKAYAEYLKNEEHYLYLNSFYQKKRDKFLKLIENSKFKGSASSGTYFQLLDFSEITSEKDVDFSKRLIKDYGLATIPISVFNLNNEDNSKLSSALQKMMRRLNKLRKL